MGCVSSSAVCDVVEDTTHDTLSINSSFITPSKSKKQPSSQSYELAARPINPSTSISDEDKLIEDYITATVNWKNQHGGSVNLDKQLKKQTPEFICIGAFIISNNQWNRFNIVSIDNKLPNTDAPYKPDLIIQNKETGRIIHVEIDENNRRDAYDENEKIRSMTIEEYFNDDAYVCFHFNPNVYGNLIDMANAFTHLMRGCEGLVYAHSHY